MYCFWRPSVVFLALLAMFVLLFPGCANLFESDNDEEENQAYSLRGLVQKGPYVTGAEITVRELDSELRPTGRTFATTIDNDTGSFAIEVELISPFVVLSASGYYFNEVSGLLSGGTLPLQALANLENSSSVNLNILTHLQQRRMEYLIENGSSFSEARQQSLNELLVIFEVDDTIINDFTALDISQRGEGNAALLSVSAIVLSNRTEATMTELLSRIGTDIRTDGNLDSDSLKNELVQGAQAIDPAAIRANLESRYESLGASSSIPDFAPLVERFIDATPDDGTDDGIDDGTDDGIDDAMESMTGLTMESMTGLTMESMTGLTMESMTKPMLYSSVVIRWKVSLSKRTFTYVQNIVHMSLVRQQSYIPGVL